MRVRVRAGLSSGFNWEGVAWHARGELGGGELAAAAHGSAQRAESATSWRHRRAVTAVLSGISRPDALS
jgi:hypothetical protein